MAHAGRPRVLVAMSGGVDSSVCAYLLKSQGYDCIGVTMRLYDNGTICRTNGRTCCSLEDIEDAKSVAHALGIPYHVLDFRREFARDVIEHFCATYEAGRTPNPCIDCNRFLKFGALLDRARELGCNYVATGHYARIVQVSNSADAKTTQPSRWELRRGADPAKDQSYVLYSLTQERLAHVLLPLGGLNKERDVRRIAEEQGLINARKRDSQGICFVPDDDYAAFLERHRGRALSDGDIVDAQGQVLGRHHGAIRYTVGQRKGLGVACAHPVYVTGIDAQANTVTLGENDALMAGELVADDWIWSAPADPMAAELDRAAAAGGSIPVTAKIRYHQPDQAAHMSWGGPAEHPRAAVRIAFDAPQRAIAPGQAVVVYRGDTVLGGGTVRS